MKKLFLLFLTIAAVTVANAVEGKSRLQQINYAVISDEYNVDVPAGQCIVVGQVMSRVDYASEQPHAISGANISTLDGKNKTLTDSSGSYRLVLDSKDTSMYFFSPGYEEIVIWKYKFQSQHVVTINFYPGLAEWMINVDKPVIYVYSDQELDAEIKFSCKGELSFTYPEYHEKWNVRVSEKGLIEKSTGRTYPYLFWEAKTTDLQYQQNAQGYEGFVINTDSTIAFLESSLMALGLNETEHTDFITFWGPRMIASPYAFVQFKIDGAYELEISNMTVTPAPDAMRRVFMLFTPLQSAPQDLIVYPQALPSFERKGFTLVEWGGSELPFASLNQRL